MFLQEDKETDSLMELELWKELKQEEFLKDLDRQSEVRLKSLAEEWKRREVGT